MTHTLSSVQVHAKGKMTHTLSTPQSDEVLKNVTKKKIIHYRWL
jgi:hypothetical protein